MAAALVAALAGLMVAGCVGYVVISYTLAFGPRTDGGGRPPRLLRAALRELLTTLLVMPLYPLWLVLGASYEAAHEGEGHARGRRHPVLLLHGFGMNQTSWLYMGRRLAALGIGPLYGTTYWTPQPVRVSGEHLQRQVERIRRRESSERVDIVAHSLGGLVARYYIEKMGGAAHVGRLITIGSPHRGTRMGRFGVGMASVRDLMHDSELLGELGAFEVGKPGVAYTSIWSRADAIVIPPESSSIAPAGQDRVFDDLGHLSLLLDARVVAVVAEKLRAA